MTLIHAPKLHPIATKTLLMQAAYRRSFNNYMKVRCAKHDAAERQPCWRLPRIAGRGDSMAVCGERIAAALKDKRRASREGRVHPLTTPPRAIPGGEGVT